MLPNDSFLRNMPRVIDLETRLKWEVLVNSSDAIGYAYKRLTETLKEVSFLSDFRDAEPFRPIVAVYCWIIIDQSHAFFQILRKIQKKPDGVLDTLLKDFGESVTLMRNGMDHISQQIQNLSQRKNPTYGVYGSLAFSTPLRSDSTFSLINFSLGGNQFNKQEYCTIDMQATPEESGIGNVSFAAFDQNLKISKLVKELELSLVKMDIDAQTTILPIVKEHADKHALDYNQLFSESVRGTVYVRFELTTEK